MSIFVSPQANSISLGETPALCNSVAAQTSPGIDWEFCGRRREEETDDFREGAECSAEIAGPPEASVSYSPREYRVPNTQCNC